MNDATGSLTDADDYAPAGRLVRAFMATGGRTTAVADQLALETMVIPSAKGREERERLRFEQRQIVDFLLEPASIAEIAAHLGLPMLAAIVLVSDMAGQGLLEPFAVVETVTMDFLSRVRNAIEAI